jgi:hypothetical protein
MVYWMCNLYGRNKGQVHYFLVKTFGIWSLWGAAMKMNLEGNRLS